MLFDYLYNMEVIFETDFENTLKTNVVHGSISTLKDLAQHKAQPPSIF